MSRVLDAVSRRHAICRGDNPCRARSFSHRVRTALNVDKGLALIRRSTTQGVPSVVEKDEMSRCAPPTMSRCAAAERGQSREGSGIVDQTKLVTAASEIARNTVDYGGKLHRDRARGSTPRRAADLRRQRPGIADITVAMTDGYTTGGGLGLARRRGRLSTNSRSNAAVRSNTPVLVL
jgi:serine/threonine-protein kinase RsbT